MERLTALHDLQLFARIAVGDEEAFREIFHQYNRVLYPFVRSLVKSEQDAREIMQEVFLKLWLQRNTLPEISNPGGWLHTVTANTAYSYLRSKARYALKLKNLMPAGDTGEDILEKLDAKNVRELINKAADLLPPRRRLVFQLSRVEGLSHKEIAEKLNISENTVRNHLADAGEFMQEYLRKNGPLYIPLILLLWKEF